MRRHRGDVVDQADHVAGRIEERLHARLERRLRGRGWAEDVVPYVGYGSDGWVRVLGRVHLRPPLTSPVPLADARGWRHYTVPSAAGVAVRIRVGEVSLSVASRAKGYIDERVSVRLPAGWATATLSVDGREPVTAPVRIVDTRTRLGLVSDVDDTVIVTMLTRPFTALRNAFICPGGDREAVPGMADLYRRILETAPDAFVAYLSTGAWHTAVGLKEFLRREGYPPGPLLMTHWGPTHAGWFRSGTAHKQYELRRLFADFPSLRWILVGDDGQHDPALYADAASAAPDKVLAVLIRELAPRRRSRTSVSPHTADGETPAASGVTSVRGPDGFGLLTGLLRRRVLAP